ncbi:hypothetical protein FMM80_28750 [Schaedlerella arabinosiphila]|uniref:Uncharacterized protein n=1 Tax=Schaedlerella arabinosiphila TaxID=2044587 RepID=A0A3R8JTF4_9FIRM|nr:hypothetical protein [Schaedlerella arabinosiphila]RRK35155.1 hypothetical protein EBB54_02200 [Schaedlerella arabinosiphila]
MAEIGCLFCFDVHLKPFLPFYSLSILFRAFFRSLNSRLEEYCSLWISNS